MKPEKRALRRSFWDALAKLISVMLAAGAGSLIYHWIGSGTLLSESIAAVMAIGGFVLIWIAEYQKEKE